MLDLRHELRKFRSRRDEIGTAPDLTQLLAAKKIDAPQMVRMAEGFFTSLGVRKLPATFWQRSLFTKPRDREVVCHASAWPMDGKEDVRIKMCIEPTAEDFVTVHHELGHDYYYLAYNKQPFLFQEGANDGFHEAIGDALALSITPAYLKQIGLLNEVPSTASDTMLLLHQALDKVAFLPFGIVIDQWRWKVFSGEITPASYNASWWNLRKQYQGVVPPVTRTEADFDPGAKYHVPGNTPYTRYFLARLLQFQFYRGMCRAAGLTGPLYRCSVYGSKAAGDALQNMLALGQSKPWSEALFAMTGERKIDAGAMLEQRARQEHPAPDQQLFRPEIPLLLAPEVRRLPVHVHVLRDHADRPLRWIADDGDSEGLETSGENPLQLADDEIGSAEPARGEDDRASGEPFVAG